MKALRGTGTRWSWVVSFTLWPLNPRGKRHRYSLRRRMGGPRNRFGRSRTEKSLLPLPAIETFQPVAILTGFKGVSETCHLADTPYTCSYWLSSVRSTCYFSSKKIASVEAHCFSKFSTVEVSVPIKILACIRIGSDLDLLADLAYFSQFFTSPRTSQENNLLSDGTHASPSQSLTTKYSGRIWCSHSGGYEDFYLLGYAV
jgi:hypothetical protein